MGARHQDRLDWLPVGSKLTSTSTSISTSTSTITSLSPCTHILLHVMSNSSVSFSLFCLGQGFRYLPISAVKQSGHRLLEQVKHAALFNVKRLITYGMFQPAPCGLWQATRVSSASSRRSHSGIQPQSGTIERMSFTLCTTTLQTIGFIQFRQFSNRVKGHLLAQ
jgi:hypothetical protein